MTYTFAALLVLAVNASAVAWLTWHRYRTRRPMPLEETELYGDTYP